MDVICDFYAVICKRRYKGGTLDRKGLTLNIGTMQVFLPPLKTVMKSRCTLQGKCSPFSAWHTVAAVVHVSGGVMTASGVTGDGFVCVTHTNR